MPPPPPKILHMLPVVDLRRKACHQVALHGKPAVREVRQRRVSAPPGSRRCATTGTGKTPRPLPVATGNHPGRQTRTSAGASPPQAPRPPRSPLEPPALPAQNSALFARRIQIHLRRRTLSETSRHIRRVLGRDFPKLASCAQRPTPPSAAPTLPAILFSYTFPSASLASVSQDIEILTRPKESCSKKKRRDELRPSLGRPNYSSISARWGRLTWGILAP